MATKNLPFSKEQIEKIIQDYPTPFHIYDEKAIRENARYFNNTFSWNEGFKEYYAIKAAPNPYLMKILREEGFGCLLYTSDAADDLLCVDLGGRRIIKKK